MKILFIVNNFYAPGNGLSASARRTVDALRERGEDVRVLSGANPDPSGPEPEYILPDLKIPVFDPLIQRQGYSFSATNEKVIRAAVEWADVVHLEEPFAIQIRACEIARKLGIPCTATYHLHPENLFSSVGLRRDPVANRAAMLVWRDMVFDHCAIVQCPTENVRRRLEQWRFKAELRVISNGMVRSDAPPATAERPPFDGVYTVVCAGRYSVEKDQPTLLRAMRYARSAPDIQLVFAGRGPTERKLKREAETLLRKGILKRPPVFEFYSYADLLALYARADLYVHCATVEVEGLSCMEAIQTGLVPVIAEGELTATAQFAISAKSVFPAGDAAVLAERIDWWLGHDAERRAEAERCLRVGAEYDIRVSAARLAEMFRDAADRAICEND